MGAESSSLQSVNSLNDSLDKIEKRLFSIEDLILHHQHTVAINDGIFISGVKIRVNSHVNLLFGPVITSVTANEISIVLEIDQDATISFIIFEKNDTLLTKDRYSHQFDFELKAETPKLCVLTAFDAEKEYVIYPAGLSEMAIYNNYVQITTLSEKSYVNNLDFYIYNQNYLINKELEKNFVDKQIFTKATPIPPATTNNNNNNNNPSDNASTTSHSTSSSTSSTFNSRNKTICIIQKFSYQNLISFFQIQIFELLQYLHDTNFESNYLLIKLSFIEKKCQEFFRNYFNGNDYKSMPMMMGSSESQRSHQFYGQGMKEENQLGENIQTILNRFTMQIFCSSSYDDDLSKLLLDILYAVNGNYVPITSSGGGSSSLVGLGGNLSAPTSSFVQSPIMSPNPQHNLSGNNLAASRKGSMNTVPTTTGANLGSGNQTVGGKGSLMGLEDPNNHFLTELYSSIVDEKRIQTEKSYVEIVQLLKELDYHFLSMIARLIRRVSWKYLRQMWDRDYETIIALDQEREEQLRRIFWARREIIHKKIFKARLMKLSHVPNSVASHELAIIEKDLEILRLQCQELSKDLANSMQQMPSSVSIGHVHYEEDDLKIVILDDAFPIIKEDGFLIPPTTTNVAQVREINTEIFRFLDQLQSNVSMKGKSQYLLFLSIFPFLKNQLPSSSRDDDLAGGGKELSLPPIQWPISFQEELFHTRPSILSKADCNDLFLKCFKLQEINENYSIAFFSWNENQFYSAVTKILPTLTKQLEMNPDADYENHHHLLHLSCNAFASSNFVMSRPWMKYLQKKYLAAHEEKLRREEEREKQEKEKKRREQADVIEDPEENAPMFTNSKKILHEDFESILIPSTISVNQLSFWKFHLQPVPASTSKRITFQFEEMNLLEDSHRLLPAAAATPVTVLPISSSLTLPAPTTLNESVEMIIMKVTDTTAQIMILANFTGLIALECIDSLTGVIFLSQQYSYRAHQPVIFFFQNLLANHHYDLHSSNISSSTLSPLASASSSLNKQFLGSLTTLRSVMTTNLVPSDQVLQANSKGLAGAGGGAAIGFREDQSTSSSHQQGSSDGIANEEMIFVMNNINHKTNYGFQEIFQQLFFHSSSFFTQFKLIIHTPTFISWHHDLMEILQTLSLAEQYSLAVTSSSSASSSSSSALERKYLLKAYRLFQQSIFLQCFQNPLQKQILSNNSHYFIKCPIVELMSLLNYSKISDIYADYSLYVIQSMLFILQDLLSFYFDWIAPDQISHRFQETKPSMTSIFTRLEEEVLEEEDREFSSMRKKGGGGGGGGGYPGAGNGIDHGDIGDEESTVMMRGTHGTMRSRSRRSQAIYKIITPKVRSRCSFLSNLLLFEICPLISTEWNSLDELIISSEDIPFLQQTLAQLSSSSTSSSSSYSSKFVNKLVLLSPIPLLKDPQQLSSIEKYQIQFTRESSLALLEVCADWLFSAEGDGENEEGGADGDREVVVVTGYDQGACLSDILVELPGAAAMSRQQRPEQRAQQGQPLNPSPLINQRNHHNNSNYNNNSHARRLIRQISCGREGKVSILPHKIKPFLFQSHRNALYRFSLIPPAGTVDTASAAGGGGVFMQPSIEELSSNFLNDEGYPEYGLLSFRPSSLLKKRRGGGGSSMPSPMPVVMAAAMPVSTARVLSPKQLAEWYPDFSVLLEQGKLIFSSTKLSPSTTSSVIPTSSPYLIQRHLYAVYALLANPSSHQHTLATEFPPSLSNKEDLSNIIRVIPLLLNHHEEDQTLQKTADYLQYLSIHAMTGVIPKLNVSFLQKIFSFYLMRMMNSMAQRLLKIPSTMIFQLLIHHLISSQQIELPQGMQRIGLDEERQLRELSLGRRLLSGKEYLKEVLGLGFMAQLLSEELSRETIG